MTQIKILSFLILVSVLALSLSCNDQKISKQAPSEIRPSQTLKSPPFALNEAEKEVTLKKGQVKLDHAAIIKGFKDKNRSRQLIKAGKQIYHKPGGCVTCHGTPKKVGNLPTSLKFWEGKFKNGKDPYKMYVTLTKGFNTMVAQPQLTVEDKYAVIHYILEHYVKMGNKSEYTEVTDAYLKDLPVEAVDANRYKLTKVVNLRQYHRMDFGPTLQWTYQVTELNCHEKLSEQNIAQKSIAYRLAGDTPGGITKGNAWSLFEHDLMTVSAYWKASANASVTNNFVDWRGIGWDGSHQTYTTLRGDRLITNPHLPGWMNPDTGDFKDLRLVGRDKRRFGPLPKSWMHYRGLYKNANTVVYHYTVGDATVYETHVQEAPGVLVRHLNISDSSKDMLMRVAPVNGNAVMLKEGSQATIIKKVLDDNGVEFYAMSLKAGSGAQKIKVFMSHKSADELKAIVGQAAAADDLGPLLRGGKGLFTTKLTTQIQKSDKDEEYVVDTFTLPKNNPWKTWLRLGGFDFYPDGDKAAVATWNGDVWVVSGISKSSGDLTWQRVAYGLHQPLGVIVKDNKIYVTCRDQIVRLHDLNGDGEMDWYENFNSDHQVTEHFHEFAMGLQTDTEGNFYYAKSARHAKTALVPHHGTLIKVSKDGKSSEVLATGFRAANGICVNDDGSFFVTDQQGNWMPENRINRVVRGGYYGNHWGYHDKKSSDDSLMEPPLLWISSRMDRSPAELLWVTSDKWGPLKGSLLNIAYGAGKVFVINQGKVGKVWQGSSTEMPMGKFPTGIMRGRFNKKDGQLYACGLYAWAGSARSEVGGFYRIRYTGAKNKLLMPLSYDVTKNGFKMKFTDKISKETLENLNNCRIITRHITRSERYGSKHTNTKKINVSRLSLEDDGKTLVIETTDLAKARIVEIDLNLIPEGSDEPIRRRIHGSIFAMPEE